MQVAGVSTTKDGAAIIITIITGIITVCLARVARASIAQLADAGGHETMIGLVGFESRVELRRRQRASGRAKANGAPLAPR